MILLKNILYNNYINNYFIENFENSFINEFYNYNIIPEDCKSNSFLQNYNNYLKQKLGKNMIINCFTFLSFIKEESSRSIMQLSINDSFNISYKLKYTKFKNKFNNQTNLENKNDNLNVINIKK